MTKRQYKARSSALRQAIRKSEDSDLFAVVSLHGMTYIYNNVAHNIIYKYRTGNSGQLAVQYRATSHYRCILDTVTPYEADKVLRVASPNMRRHVRDVRARVG